MEKDFIQCDAYNDNLTAYFFNCERKPERCTEQAKWVVQVNPPSEKDDGKAYLCDFCHRWHYKFFTHKLIE